MAVAIPAGGGDASWSESALTDIATKLRNGAQDLGNVANNTPPGPDAGTSSQVVGDALAAWVTAAATSASRMESSAADINTAAGTYKETEASNTNKVNSAGTTNTDQQNFQNTNYGSPSMIYPG
jgi:hypothetical protein